MGIFKTIAEGGQIWAHRMRMLRQVIRIGAALSLSLATLSLGYKMLQIPTFYYQAAWYFGKAKALSPLEEKISVNPAFWAKIEKRRTSNNRSLHRPEAVMQACKRPATLLWKTSQQHFLSAFLLFFKIFVGTVLFFLLKGIASRKRRHVTGQKESSAWKIALLLRIKRKASPIKLGKMPLVKDTEARHILISGGTGSGKTNCFHHILPQIRKTGQKAVIVDTSGEFVSKYYREGKDLLLNPFDARGLPWHPWAECKDTFDITSLAQSFIPSSYNEEENFWRKGAQEVFCAILNLKSSEKKISEAVKLLLYSPLSELYHALKDTKASSFLDMSSEKTSASIRAVAAAHLEALELLEDTESPFSIREWVNRNDESWLFLTSTVSQRASLTPILSAWFSIAMRSLIQLDPQNNRHLWFIADELPTLNRLRDLETCLTESRKFGGCALLALQSPAQLEIIYGREMTKVILGNCGTRIAFAEQDPEIAARISKTFGEKESKEHQESISYGASEIRDGVNLSYQTKTTPVVSATQIQALNAHEAFVKLPGNFPISKLKFPYKDPKKICDAFIQKNG